MALCGAHYTEKMNAAFNKKIVKFLSQDYSSL